MGMMINLRFSETKYFYIYDNIIVISSSQEIGFRVHKKTIKNNTQLQNSILQNNSIVYLLMVWYVHQSCTSLIYLSLKHAIINLIVRFSLHVNAL